MAGETFRNYISGYLITFELHVLSVSKHPTALGMGTLGIPPSNNPLVQPIPHTQAVILTLALKRITNP